MLKPTTSGGWHTNKYESNGYIIWEASLQSVRDIVELSEDCRLRVNSRSLSCNGGHHHCRATAASHCPVLFPFALLHPACLCWASRTGKRYEENITKLVLWGTLHVKSERWSYRRLVLKGASVVDVSSQEIISVLGEGFEVLEKTADQEIPALNMWLYIWFCLQETLAKPPLPVIPLMLKWVYNS